MPKAQDILGMNARDGLFTGLNSSDAKAFTNSKYATKALLYNKNIPTAKVFAVLATVEDINSFDWATLGDEFVIKPTNGNAGKGVVAFAKMLKSGQLWKDQVGEKWTLQDLRIHCYDILEGQYSTYGLDHKIIIEEFIKPHPLLKKYSYGGTADVRVVVYNKVPIMALLRLPTEESGGRANQSQGAIGVGIDMATGITTHATKDLDTFIEYLPDTRKKLRGIKLPFWKEILKVSIEAADAAGLYYAGIDLFIDQNKGPLVVELNANPGLSIQIANKAGLRKRLERVQGLHVNNPEHGVRIAQALFAESFSDKLIAKDGLTIVSAIEPVEIYGDDRKKKTKQARMNTARFRSAIAGSLAQELGLVDVDDLLWFQNEGSEGRVPVVPVTLKLKDKKLKTEMVVSKKLEKTSYSVDIGRKDLAGYLVNPTK